MNGNKYFPDDVRSLIFGDTGVGNKLQTRICFGGLSEVVADIGPHLAELPHLNERSAPRGFFEPEKHMPASRKIGVEYPFLLHLQHFL